MDYKPDIIIKQEEEEIIEDKNDNYLQLSFDVHVKIENHSVISDDWSLQNVLPFDENYQETVSHETLKQENLQTCMICQDFFYDSFSLLKHNLIHLKVPLIKRKLFMCEECPNFYKNKSELQNHILNSHSIGKVNSNVHITKQLHTCLLCKKTYSYKHWFSHIREVHGQQVKCEMCNRTFKCDRYLKRHIRFVHNGEPRAWQCNFKVDTKCPKCPSILDSRSALTTHLRNCHSDRKFSCHLCKSTLKCKSYLQTHLKRIHFNDGLLYNCKLCGKDFKSIRYLRVHIKNTHSKAKSHDVVLA